MPLTRRQLLGAAAAFATTIPAMHAESDIVLQIPATAPGAHMPNDFIGLSYEIQQLTDPSFFSPANTGLIEQFKDLSSSGVLRLGGNTGEFGWWKPTPEFPEPSHPQTRIVEGEPKPDYYPVTSEAVQNLSGFLKATGWSCIYGIGMGTNKPDRAAAEAAFAARTLGDRLQYFQIGNEPDLFSRHLRDPKTWSVRTYLQEWLSLARAVAARVPGAKFGLPDVASDIEWLPEIAAMWSAEAERLDIAALTHHYYFGGPATNPAVNIPNLMSPATMAKVQRTADTATAAARRMGTRIRMTEGNTCYRGGKPGLSDVFAAALWAADYSLLLAQNNYCGVNLHGGTGKSVANGLGGFLPGDVMLENQGETRQQIATHPHPFYTPIATFGSEYKLEPVAYGLKFAGLLSGSTIMNVDLTSKLQASKVDASAYAATLPDGSTAVVILNKTSDRSLHVSLDFGPRGPGQLEITSLKAPALNSREAHISAPEKQANTSTSVVVPAATGLLIKRV